MQIQQNTIDPNRMKLVISADTEEMTNAKQSVIRRLGKHTKVDGFRLGKAPLSVLERNIDPAHLQSEFLNETINLIYPKAIAQLGLMVIAEPDISITKFVPFSELEFNAEVEIISEIKLPDYTKIKLAKPKITVTAKDVNLVLNNLSERAAERVKVSAPVVKGNEVVLDFKGVDAKTKQPIAGADAENYRLIIGSNSFIDGFEDQLIGLKANDHKTFKLVFPKDYGLSELRSKEVEFSVTINEVYSLKPHKLDDAFAASVGPFKTIDELKADIKRQLTLEKQNEANQKLDNDLMLKIAEQTEVSIPDKLIQQELERMEDEEKRNLIYRGQTWQEHLKAEGLSESAHRDKERPAAELRIKTGLIFGEIALKEKIKVSQTELDDYIQMLKGRYSDPQMQAELSTPDGKRDIESRLIIEKTLDRLRQLATSA
jgi:trigger factor